MPNWTETEMAVVLPSDNAARFLGLFLSQDEKENAGKAEYFGRTFLTDHSEEKNGKGMSSLNESIDPDPTKPHSFDERQDGVTVFYGRDRGETDQKSAIVDLAEIDSPSSWIEYCYVFGKDGKWRYFECGHLKEGMKDLQLGLDEEYQKLGFARPEGYYGFYTQDDIAKRQYDYKKSIQAEM